jgi:predicted nucleic acid-binding protein
VTSVFIDTNIFLRHILQDNQRQSPLATAWLARVETGDIRATTSAAALAEVVFVLERTHKNPKAQIREVLLDLLALDGLSVPGVSSVFDALDLYVSRNISYTDAFNAVEMMRRGVSQVLSFDRDFDRIDGLERIEP